MPLRQKRSYITSKLKLKVYSTSPPPPPPKKKTNSHRTESISSDFFHIFKSIAI